MRTRLSGAAFVLAALGFLSPASAMVVEVTDWGTVAFGYDQTGIFGVGGGDLAGDAYVAHYTFDTSRGWAYSGPAPVNFAYGGKCCGDASPAISASVTINGYTVNFLGDYLGEIYGFNVGNFSEQYHFVQSYVDNRGVYINNYLQNWVSNSNGSIPSSITGPFIYNTMVGDSATGALLISTYDGNSNDWQVDTYAGLVPTTLEVSPYADLTGASPTVSGVPEPSIWAMMVIGFAAIGSAAFRRGRKDRLAPTFV